MVYEKELGNHSPRTLVSPNQLQRLLNAMQKYLFSTSVHPKFLFEIVQNGLHILVQISIG